jgi:ABC-type branched-subunit amino acid transport system substrate-binding protein
MKQCATRIVLAVLVLFLAASPVFAGGEQEMEQPDEFVLGFISSLSGTFAAVAETQRMGTQLAVEQINEDGGLDMPWGRVPVRMIVKDDEAKLDVGVRRFRELVDEGIHGVVGTVWNPMAAAINEETKITPVPYIAACVPALDSFRAGNPAPGSYSVAFTPWSIGYLAGASVINELGAETIYFVSRADSWGATIYEGLEAALAEHGGEVVGFAEFPKGNVDFSTAVNEALELEPDIFMATQFAGDAIALFKQAYDMGLTEVSTMFNTWITNVVAQGIPAAALSEVYALSYYYYDMAGFQDPVLVERAAQYTEDHMDMYGEPPDAYGTIAYIATTIMFEAVEEAGTFDVDAVSEVLAAKSFETVKGDTYFREDHEMVGDYLAFIVKGKDPAEAMGEWDVFEVMGYFGGESALPSLESLGY